MAPAGLRRELLLTLTQRNARASHSDYAVGHGNAMVKWRKRLRGLLCFCGLAFAAKLLTIHAPASGVKATSVNDHLSAISWFSGTFACTSNVTYSNGKKETVKWTVVTSRPDIGWLRFAIKGEGGIDYYGYDPEKNKYVMLGTGGPGDYAATYFSVGKDRSISIAFNNEFSDTSSYSKNIWKMTPVANGYTIARSGPSQTYPGFQFHEIGACLRR